MKNKGSWKKGHVPWNKGKKYKLEEIHSKEKAEEIRIKMRDSMVGKKHTEEAKEKMKKTYKEKYETGYENNRKGKETPESTKIKLSKANKGRKPWITGGHHTEKTKEKISKSKIGNKHTEKAKMNMRISRCNYIKKVGGPTFGKNETQILNEFELSNGIKLIRQYSIVGYLIDGCCKELNLVVEVYEKFHENQKEKDEKRKQKIINKLNCDFVIIEDNFDNERTK